jgi:hypothetical protein
MVKVRVYIVAAVITAVLVMSGFALNWYFNEVRQADMVQSITELDTSMSESQLELLYVTQFSDEGCGVLEKSRQTTTESLMGVNRELVSTEQNLILPDWQWNQLKTEQTILYIKLWMLTKEMKNTCDTNVSTILYFFDTSSEASKQQGYVLDSITNQYGAKRVLVVPLDYNFNLGMIKILRVQYNVTSTPTLVINEKTKLEGSVSKAEIVQIAGL